MFFSGRRKKVGFFVKSNVCLKFCTTDATIRLPNGYLWSHRSDGIPNGVFNDTAYDAVKVSNIWALSKEKLIKDRDGGEKDVRLLDVVKIRFRLEFLFIYFVYYYFHPPGTLFEDERWIFLYRSSRVCTARARDSRGRSY